VAMSEFWDWKIADSELASINLSIIESRSTFGFWAPVDEQMIKTMQDFAQISNLEFSSPYWDHYFMAYLDYPTYQSYSPSALLNASYAAVVAAVGIGTYTPTGHYYEQMYLSPDTQAPSVPSAPSVSPGYTTAAVSWAPSSDNVGTAGYLIYRNGAYIQRINALVLYDSGLSQGTQYSYSVAAFDASGNISQQSGATSVKTYTGNQNSPRRLRLARKNGRVN
jgi:hypothetical protein